MILGDEVFHNKRKLNIPGRKIGASWNSILDAWDECKKRGKNEEEIDEILTKMIVTAQNQYYGKETEKKEDKALEEKKSESDVCSKKKKMKWQEYLKNPNDFKKYTFSVYDMFSKMDEKKSKEIISLVIGKKGHYFKEWTAYWDLGSIYYDHITMNITICIFSEEKKKFGKFKTISRFIRSNISWNITKYEKIREKKE